MKKNEPKENQLLNLLFNIAIPVIILIKFSKEDYLGPVAGLIIALLFPLVYGAYDFIKRRSYNFYSAVGLISILLTGGIGLLKLDAKWLAIKEAGVPLILGIIVLLSLKSPFPFVKKMLFAVIDEEIVNAALQKKHNQAKFQHKLISATYWIVAVFCVSAALNYILAKIIVVSPSGTEEFNAEIGRMTALSFPVIALPVTIMMIVVIIFLLRDLIKLTGLSEEELVKQKEDGVNTKKK
jgi:hypothetical protein